MSACSRRPWSGAGGSSRRGWSAAIGLVGGFVVLWLGSNVYRLDWYGVALLSVGAGGVGAWVSPLRERACRVVGSVLSGLVWPAVAVLLAMRLDPSQPWVSAGLGGGVAAALVWRRWSIAGVAAAWLAVTWLAVEGSPWRAVVLAAAVGWLAVCSLSASLTRR